MLNRLLLGRFPWRFILDDRIFLEASFMNFFCHPFFTYSGPMLLVFGSVNFFSLLLNGSVKSYGWLLPSLHIRGFLSLVIDSL